MMPGVRSFGRVGASPALEHFVGLRNAPPALLDARRQAQQGQYSQQGFPQVQAVQRVGGEPDRASGSLASLLLKHQQQQPPQQPPPAPDLHHEERQNLGWSRQSDASSGSEHEPSSDYLAGLVSHFMEVEESVPAWKVRGGSSPVDEDDDDSGAGMVELSASVQALSSSATPAESRLFSDVLCALQLARSTAALQQDSDAPPQGGINGPCMRRAVMSRLRAVGYNAAVCKSRWEHSRGIPGGDYEFIDVVIPSDPSPLAPPRERLIVDLDFRAQFQVARPTAQFSAALLATPVVFVGRVERLQQVVELLSDACRKSLRVQGLHLPPWRKSEYLRAKWLAPYKRTTNATVSAPHNPSAARNVAEVPPSRGPEARSPLKFGLWPEVAQVSGMVKRNCQGVERQGTAPKGVLGMLLQEHVGKPSAVS